MKKIFFLIIVVFISTYSFSQQGKKEALSKGKMELLKSKEVGKFQFVLPEGNSKETVASNSKYYSMYFTVSYNENNNEAEITMVTNDEKSRHVICRFLVASGVEQVNVDGKSFSVEDFYKDYLK